MTAERTDLPGDDDAFGDEDDTAAGAEAVETSASELLPAGTRVGRFLVVDYVASGGMGALYRAVDPELERSVAIKLVRTGREDGGAAKADQERLLREARTLARLSHPNVVSIYEAGTFDERVFLAMEFVQGTTLRAWLAAKPRSVRDVLTVFLAAGEGLAAAHAAGIVHRDFKPENVLVGDDGRVRVVDFGVALDFGAGDTPRAERKVATAQDHDAVNEASRLTALGAVVGTPRYMAPEQHRGGDASERSDQFSFAVALYEALYGQLPFAARTQTEWRRAVEAGAVQPLPFDTKVPRWIRRELLTALAADESLRFPSMRQLLSRLRADPLQRRWRAVQAVVLVLAAVVPVAVYARVRQQRTELCAGASNGLEGVWDDGKRAVVRRAFLATGLPFAEDAARSVERSFDGYTATWASMHQDACEATHVRREQSTELFDLRMQCLAHRRQALRAQVDVLAAADAETVTRAAQLAQTLPQLADCADAKNLRAATPMPSDPAARARIDDVRSRVARARALHEAGKAPEGIAIAEGAVAASAPLHFEPLEAEALLVHAYLQEDVGSYDDAARSLRGAGAMALAAHDDNLLAKVWVQLAWVLGERQARFSEAHTWADYAGAVIRRDPSAEHERGHLLRTRGSLLYREGKWAEALATGKEALAWVEQHEGAESLLAASCVGDIADVLFDMGDYENAIAYHERVLGIRKARLGPKHPAVANTLSNLGNSLQMRGEPRRAVALYREALDVFASTVGDRGPGPPVVTMNMAEALLRLGDNEGAMQTYQQALDLLAAAGRSDSDDYGTALSGQARAHLAWGHVDLALAKAAEGVRLVERRLGPDHPDLASALEVLGNAQLAKAMNAAALQTLKRAVRILELHPGDPERSGTTRFALARALAATGGADARAEAQRAREDLVKAGARGAPVVALIDAW